jgi:hypothetical protein
LWKNEGSPGSQQISESILPAKMCIKGSYEVERGGGEYVKGKRDSRTTLALGEGVEVCGKKSDRLGMGVSPY